MTQEIYWCVELPQGGWISSTIECTRREAIDAYARIWKKDPTPAERSSIWRKAKRKGNRCVKVTIGEVEAPIVDLPTARANPGRLGRFINEFAEEIDCYLIAIRYDNGQLTWGHGWSAQAIKNNQLNPENEGYMATLLLYLQEKIPPRLFDVGEAE